MVAASWRAGGNRVRLVLSNAFGTAALDIGAGHVARRDQDAAIVASSAKPLRSLAPGASG